MIPSRGIDCTDSPNILSTAEYTPSIFHRCPCPFSSAHGRQPPLFRSIRTHPARFSDLLRHRPWCAPRANTAFRVALVPSNVHEILREGIKWSLPGSLLAFCLFLPGRNIFLEFQRVIERSTTLLLACPKNPLFIDDPSNIPVGRRQYRPVRIGCRVIFRGITQTSHG